MMDLYTLSTRRSHRIEVTLQATGPLTGASSEVRIWFPQHTNRHELVRSALVFGDLLPNTYHLVLQTVSQERVETVVGILTTRPKFQARPVASENGPMAPTMIQHPPPSGPTRCPS